MKKAFTLIELLVTIAIIGILAALVLINLSSARARARDATRKNDLNQISKALEMYYADNEIYPELWNNNRVYRGIDNSSYAATNNWRSDLIVADLADALVPTYIKKLPVDPINTGGQTGYQYVYMCTTQKWIIVNAAPVQYSDAFQGKFFQLMTRLENQQDSMLAKTTLTNLFQSSYYCSNYTAFSPSNYYNYCVPNPDGSMKFITVDTVTYPYASFYISTATPTNWGGNYYKNELYAIGSLN